jgi:ribosome maturation factor RimP
MAQKPIAKTVEEFLNPIVEGLGYEIVEVEYAKKPNGMNLTIFIDSVNGIKIEDCEKVHSAIDEPLDELDPTNGASYTLNVSSPGLDRPLSSDKDLKRNLNQMVEISLYSKMDGKKQYVGTLASFNEDEIIILEGEKQIIFQRSAIAKITKFIEF